MRKRRIFSLLLAVIVLLGISGCGKNSFVTYDQAKLKPSSEDSWSVFVYMCGGTVDENNVYSALDEMMDVKYTDNVKFIVETGGKSEWSRDGIYNDYAQRFLMQNNSMFLAKQKAETDMCTDDELTDFLDWGIDTYPADHYALVIWGEGSGLQNGVCIDEQNDYDSLSLEKIYYSLSKSNEHFDFVGFDASYMSNMETAISIAPYADYMVGSEETISPNGWDYKRFADYIVKHPDAKTEDVCKEICDGYYEKCDEFADISTMSVTDLSHATELLLQFDGMAGMMVRSTDTLEYCANLMRKLQYVESCGAKSSYENYTDMVDLGNLAETIQKDIGSTANVLIQTLNESVVYNVCGDKRPYMKGLGVYFPYSGTAESIENYCKVFRSHNCLTFARKVSINATTELGLGEEDYNASWAYCEYLNRMGNFGIEASIDGDMYRLDTTGDPQIIKNVGLNMYTYNPELGKYLKLGTSYDIDGEEGVGNSFETSFPTKCLSINGHNVMSIRVEEGFVQDIYSIPILLNGENANIRVVHQFADKKDKYEILGVWKGVDPASKMDSRDFTNLEKGDKITPLFEPYDGGELVEGKTFSIGMFGSRAGMSKIKNQASYEYSVEDIYGNKHNADLYSG